MCARSGGGGVRESAVAGGMLSSGGEGWPWGGGSAWCYSIVGARFYLENSIPGDR